MQNGRIVDQTWWMLRITFGVVPIVAGLDKFVGVLADWPAYLSPVVARMLPVSPEAFMGIVGVIEVIAGVIVLTKYTRIGAWVVAAWLVGIALNLLSTGQYFDIAVRDLVMSVGAVSLARLSAAREGARAPEATATSSPRIPAHA
ncbi:MAG: DoxX family membrane protein [Myxococcaceae bacterium]